MPNAFTAKAKAKKKKDAPVSAFTAKAKGMNKKKLETSTSAFSRRAVTNPLVEKLERARASLKEAEDTLAEAAIKEHKLWRKVDKLADKYDNADKRHTEKFADAKRDWHSAMRAVEGWSGALLSRSAAVKLIEEEIKNSKIGRSNVKRRRRPA